MKFGFVVHPLTAFQRRLLGVRGLNGPLAIGRPALVSEAIPYTIAALDIRDVHGGRSLGQLVSVPFTPEELLSDQEGGVRAVLGAVARCHAWGAEVVGLGAVAAVIGGQGKAVAAEAPCAVTTGNGFTAWAAVQTLDLWRRTSGESPPVALLGAPSPVATSILRQLAARGEAVEVVAQTPPKPLRALVETLASRGYAHLRFIDDPLEALRQGHVLVAASSTGARLKLSALPRGSVVIDVAAPLDVQDDARRPDVLWLDGEYVRLPTELGGGLWHRVYGLVTGHSRHAFACFAEPMLLALAGRPELANVGREVAIERTDALAELAHAHGFWVDRLYERGRPLRAERWRAWRRAAGLTSRPWPDE